MEPVLTQLDVNGEDSSGSEGSLLSAGIPTTETDRFGFILGSESTVGSEGPPPEVVRQRETKWLNIISQWDRILLKKAHKIKDQCRKGIPTSLKSRCWPLLCVATEKIRKNEDLYEKLKNAPALQSWVDVIERDLDRQFPFHEMFISKDGHGQQELFQVLKAYTQYRPEEGYCQGQGPVAAVLLMNMPAKDAFWCLVQISEYYLPGYYSPLLEGVLFDAGLLNGILRKACPAAYKHIKKYGVEPLMFATDWLMCLYTRHLPFPTLLRVWDLFFCYGVRVLFQVAVVLVRRSLGKQEQRDECEGQIETLERLRKVKDRILQEDNAFIEEVCSVSLSWREFERETEKELKKWKKDRPSSTFNPWRRCHGYQAAWLREREEEEEKKRRQRCEGNLSIPLSPFQSLSPHSARKLLRRASKAEVNEKSAEKEVMTMAVGTDDMKDMKERCASHSDDPVEQYATDKDRDLQQPECISEGAINTHKPEHSPVVIGVQSEELQKMITNSLHLSPRQSETTNSQSDIKESLNLAKRIAITDEFGKTVPERCKKLNSTELNSNLCDATDITILLEDENTPVIQCSKCQNQNMHLGNTPNVCHSQLEDQVISEDNQAYGNEAVTTTAHTGSVLESQEDHVQMNIVDENTKEAEHQKTLEQECPGGPEDQNIIVEDHINTQEKEEQALSDVCGNTHQEDLNKVSKDNLNAEVAPPKHVSVETKQTKISVTYTHMEDSTRDINPIPQKELEMLGDTIGILGDSEIVVCSEEECSNVAQEETHSLAFLENDQPDKTFVNSSSKNGVDVAAESTLPLNASDEVLLSNSEVLATDQSVQRNTSQAIENTSTINLKEPNTTALSCSPESFKTQSQNLVTTQTDMTESKEPDLMGKNEELPIGGHSKHPCQTSGNTGEELTEVKTNESVIDPHNVETKSATETDTGLHNKGPSMDEECSELHKDNSREDSLKREDTENNSSFSNLSQSSAKAVCFTSQGGNNLYGTKIQEVSSETSHDVKDEIQKPCTIGEYSLCKESNNKPPHSRRLSEDTFKDPQGDIIDAQDSAATNEAPSCVVEKTEPSKRFGLFRRLKGDHGKENTNVKTNIRPATMTVPIIVIEDFSGSQQVPEERLTSREKRRRRREQERREKEEKAQKKKEKEIEKERNKERKRPQTRGQSFQVRSSSKSGAVSPSTGLSTNGPISKRNSAPYFDTYF